MESSRTSLASRTHFEVLGLEGQVLGLEASSSRKLACPRLEDSTIFWIVKNLWRSLEKFFGKRFFVEIAWKIFVKIFFFWDRLKNFVSLVLGLEHSGPWPREFLSSERLFLALDFFVSLALASSLVFSTPPLVRRAEVRRLDCNTKGAFRLDAKHPKFDVIDSSRKVAAGRNLREQLRNSACLQAVVR